MNVSQIYELMNTVTAEVLGESAVVQEDLSNVVDLGTEIFNANAVDNYVHSLVDHIGRVIFVNRTYAGSTPSVLMDGWEFGSVLEKIQMDLPEATENESWNLIDGATYDQQQFYKPTISAKFFNSKITFEVPISITEKQVKESFSSVEQLNGFVSMIYNAVDKTMTIKIDSLVQKTINTMIAETLYSEYPTAAYTASSGVRAVNLYKLYKTDYPSTTLTAATCVKDPDFIRYAAFKMGLYMDRLSKMSTLFNIGGKERFTPSDMLHVITLSEFQKAADVYLQSSTYHNEFVKLPNAETVPYWQGSGTDYGFSSTSKIMVKTADATVTASGILGVMFDRDALGVCNQDRRVTSAYNAKGEFWNNYYKFDCSYFADENENFVVFFVA